MIGRIARKEFLEMVRDGRFRVTTAVVLLLLVAALGMGWKRFDEVRTAHLQAQKQERRIWESQGEKSPHSAAHYGVYAFKPTGPLAFVDQGTEAYTGVTVWLEAHKQNQFLYRPARDSNTLQRFGDLTAAAVLQLLLPLFIVMMAFSAFAGEREQGTLRQLVSLGVRSRDLAIGKALGVAGGLFLLLAPASLVGASVLTLASPEGGPDSGLPRILLLAAAYTLYFGVFIGVALTISAWAHSARLALVALLGFWIFVCLVVPRAVTDVGRQLYPTPTANQFAQILQADMQQAQQDGDYEEFMETKKQELLRRYNVFRVEDLPINYAGFSLQAGEEWGNRFFDRHYSRLWDSFESQNRFYQTASVLAPMLAVRSISMGLAGTDFEHFRHFSTAAENYRRDFVGFLNDDMRDHAGAQDSAYVQTEALWSRMPQFSYETPGIGWVIERQQWSLILLSIWFLVAALLAFWRAHTLEVA